MKKIYIWTSVIAAVTSILLVIDFNTPNHPLLHFENIPLFYMFLGFFSCVAIVVLSKIVGVFLKRPDNYYEYAVAKPESRDSND